MTHTSYVDCHSNPLIKKIEKTPKGLKFSGPPELTTDEDIQRIIRAYGAQINCHILSAKPQPGERIKAFGYLTLCQPIIGGEAPLADYLMRQVLEAFQKAGKINEEEMSKAKAVFGLETGDEKHRRLLCEAAQIIQNLKPGQLANVVQLLGILKGAPEKTPIIEAVGVLSRLHPDQWPEAIEALRGVGRPARLRALPSPARALVAGSSSN